MVSAQSDHNAMTDAQAQAADIDAEIRALPQQNAPSVRTIRHKYSRQIKDAEPDFVLQVAGELVRTYGYRSVPYELILYHKKAYRNLDETRVKDLGRGIDSWGAVDSYARLLSGPAWRDGLVPDQLIHGWARSEDRWWRRAALVSTVALNVRSHGGTGDVARTLAVCRLLVDDPDDMVVKAMSWALRELVVHALDAVRAFLEEYDDRLAARVKREVRNKLATGLKDPGRQK
jgi:3-methyladenine DNA glycosylase AlkD